MSRIRGFLTVRDTVWLYPESDIQAALASTTQPYTDDGTNIVVPTLDAFNGLYLDIFNQTAISQPVGNTGFTLGVGTLLEDFQKVRQFCLPSGQVLVRWRLVQQISPQTNPPIATPGNSPQGTVGYVTTFCAFGGPSLPYPLDPVLVVRVG